MHHALKTSINIKLDYLVYLFIYVTIYLFDVNLLLNVQKIADHTVILQIYLSNHISIKR